MIYDSQKHHRRSIRLKEYDYSQAGAYFITIATHDHNCLFGEIIDGKMCLNKTGEIVAEEWLRSAEIRKEIRLDEFVVMPNHIHGIVIIDRDAGQPALGQPAGCPYGLDGVVMIVGVTGGRPSQTGGCSQADRLNSNSGATNRLPLRGPKPKSIGAFVAGLKSVVTKRINQILKMPNSPVWQRNYYEHVIRNEDDLNKIREYIINNPLKWDLDKENPKNVL